MLQQMVDQKSSLVAAKLGVPRGSVHFVENYHGAEQDQGTPTGPVVPRLVCGARGNALYWADHELCGWRSQIVR